MQRKLRFLEKLLMTIDCHPVIIDCLRAFLEKKLNDNQLLMCIFGNFAYDKMTMDCSCVFLEKK